MSSSTSSNANDTLARLHRVIEQRKAGDPDKSYVARLFQKGTDAILKKVGEEATEVVMACKDGDPRKIVAETADLWFHSMLALSAFRVAPADVIATIYHLLGVDLDLMLDDLSGRPIGICHGGQVIGALVG